jgi:hypothetical protein
LAQEAAEAQGLIKSVRIGQALARLFEAQALVTLYESLLRTRPYAVYGLPEPNNVE